MEFAAAAASASSSYFDFLSKFQASGEGVVVVVVRLVVVYSLFSSQVWTLLCTNVLSHIHTTYVEKRDG